MYDIFCLMPIIAMLSPFRMQHKHYTLTRNSVLQEPAVRLP